LFLRRRIFSSLRKALHCNWRAFSIVDRLYFFSKIFGRFGPARAAPSMLDRRLAVAERLDDSRQGPVFDAHERSPGASCPVRATYSVYPPP
jgi:hypothetical protein